MGRSAILEDLESFVASTECIAAVLPGRGGIGKSRIIRALAEALERAGTRQVRFLAEGQGWTALHSLHFPVALSCLLSTMRTAAMIWTRFSRSPDAVRIARFSGCAPGRRKRVPRSEGATSMARGQLSGGYELRVRVTEDMDAEAVETVRHALRQALRAIDERFGTELSASDVNETG